MKYNLVPYQITEIIKKNPQMINNMTDYTISLFIQQKLKVQKQWKTKYTLWLNIL